MTDTLIRAPRFDIGAAMTQVFNLPSGNGYLLRVMGFASLLLTVSFVLLGIPIVKAYASVFENMMALDMADLSDAEEMAAAYSVMAPLFAAMGFFFLLYIIQIGTYISVEVALYRNIIRGEDKGFFPLRFGMDEFKVLITRIVVALILYAAFMVAYFGFAVLGLMIFGLGSSVGSTVVLGIAGLIMFLLVLALIGALVYASIRLAPSAAFSVRDEVFTPVGSWGTMKTYFWPAFGSVLVIGIIGYIALMVFSLLAFGILIYASGIIPIMMALESNTNDIPDFSPLLEMLTSVGFIVPSIIVMAIATFFSFLYMGAIWSIWGYVAKLTERPDVLLGTG